MIRTALLFIGFISLLFSQNLNPVVIQELGKMSQKELQEKLKNQGENSVKNKVKSISDNKKSQDLSLQNNDERLDALKEIEERRKKEAFFGERFFKLAEVLPKTYGPVPDSYLLGAGDELIITLFGEVQLSFELTLDRENNIFPENVGKISLGGLNFGEAKEVIKKAFSKSYSTLKGRRAKTKLYLSVGKHRKIHVSVIGEVKQAKNMILSSLNTVFDAIVLAGGPNEDAAIRRVEIKRGDQVLYHDLYGDLIPSLKSKAIRLEDSDVIFVSTKKETVEISGGVRLEGQFEISSKSTLSDMLTIAGGLKQNASIDKISIASIRKDQVITLPFNSQAERNNYILKDGDVIHVNEKVIRDSLLVEITGSVIYPGEYAFRKNKSIKDYIDEAGGFKDFTYQKRFEILRRLNSKEYKTLTFNKDEITKAIVQNGDIISIFSELDFIDARQVFVVSYAQGFFTFDYFKNSDVYSYLAKIGGFRYTEDNSFVEIVRLAESNVKYYAKEYKLKIDPNYLDVTTARKNEFKIQPDDIIIIRKNPSYEDFQTVKLFGEVQSVGSYPIVKRGEKILDIIKRANGLRSSAYIDGIRYFRKRNIDFDLINDTTKLSPYIRIPLDYHQILSDPYSDDNIAVADEDSIFVPRNPYTVIVQGEVGSPQAVIFESGKSVDYYLAQAGGLSAYADGSRIQVVKANGKHLKTGLFSSDDINAGTIITVPREKKEDDASNVISTIFQSVSAIVTTLVLIKQL